MEVESHRWMRARRWIAALVTLLVASSVALAAAAPGASAQGSSWTVVPSPSPGTNSNFLTGVSCTSAAFCMAVGYTGDSSSAQTLIEQWNGSPWSVVPSPNVGSDNNQLTSVSCTSKTFCMAVGYAGNPVYPQTLIEQWDGSSWSVVSSPSPGRQNYLEGVSCTSTTFCATVGMSGYGTYQTLIEQWDGSSWSVAVNAGGEWGFAVSCTSSSFCMAVGGDLAESWNGSSWSVASIPSSGSGTHNLDGVSCLSATFCTVAGWSTPTAGMDQALIESWDGSSWSVVSSPSPGANGTDLLGISCADATFCTAVGYADNAILDTLVETWDGSSWSVVSSPSPGINRSVLEGSSCASATFCVAAGEYSDPSSGGRTLIEQGSEAPVPAPTITSVSPPSGPQAGGTPVTIVGTNFAPGATTVAFGSNAATSASCASATICTATSPAGTGTVDVTVTTSAGTSATSSADAFSYLPPPAPYHALTPSRICDTRISQSPNPCTGETLGKGATDVVGVAGQGGVPPSGGSAVVVNVTAADPTETSYFTVYPDGATKPLASSLNFHTGQNVPNLVTVGLPADGKIDVFNALGTADLIVDVEGYYGPSAAGAGLYDALSPERICDTRIAQAPNQCTGKAPGAGSTLDVQVTGEGGVPASGVAAVVANVTAIGSPSPGYLTVFPEGTKQPSASNLNYGAGAVVPNRVIVPVSASGKISIYTGNGAPQIAVDVSGYFTDASNPRASGAEFTPAPSPERICDTRAAQPENQCTGKTLGPAGILAVASAGQAGVPADATAVVANVTAAGSTQGGYFTVYPGPSKPVASDLNFSPDVAVANMVVATLGQGPPAGSFSVYNARGSTDLIVDLVGWYS